MFDELDHLRASADLRRLLGHYAELGADNRAAWQDRVMSLDSTEARALVKLHGELIGLGWIEQNTGFTKGSRPGLLVACYRVTSQGQRALHRAQMPREDEEDAAEAA
jgi:hypothetical protein